MGSPMRKVNSRSFYFSLRFSHVLIRSYICFNMLCREPYYAVPQVPRNGALRLLWNYQYVALPAFLLINVLLICRAPVVVDFD